MGHVPQDAKWYIAELIVEIRVEGSAANIVHQNLVLVRADSPDEAFRNAVTIGSNYASSYSNPEGRLVTTAYRGISYLDVIHDDLENGAELLFSQQTSVAEEQIERLLRTRDELLLFKDQLVESGVPDYASGEVVKEALQLLNNS